MKNSTILRFIFVLILLLLVGTLFYYVTYSTDKKIQIIKEQSATNIKTGGLHSSNQLKEEMRILSDQEKTIENSFIVSSKVLDFIRVIESSAESKGLKIIIEKVEPGEKEPLLVKNKTISNATFTIQINGAYDSIILFVKEMLQNEKKLTLNQINLYRSDIAGKIEYTVRIKLTGIIVTYE